MIYVSRKEHFNAAHKLYNPEWSKEKNEEVFGPCANENWHGHNFDLIVTVKGQADPDTGFVIDFKVLGDIIKSQVIEKLDHKNLNLDVEFMEGKLTTCENLIVEIWNVLEPEIRNTGGGRLHSLKLFETNRNFAEYYGE